MNDKKLSLMVGSLGMLQGVIGASGVGEGGIEEEEQQKKINKVIRFRL